MQLNALAILAGSLIIAGAIMSQKSILRADQGGTAYYEMNLAGEPVTFCLLAAMAKRCFPMREAPAEPLARLRPEDPQS